MIGDICGGSAKLPPPPMLSIMPCRRKQMIPMEFWPYRAANKTHGNMQDGTIYNENQIYMQEPAHAPLIPIRLSNRKGHRPCVYDFVATSTVFGCSGNIAVRKLASTHNFCAINTPCRHWICRKIAEFKKNRQFPCTAVH